MEGTYFLDTANHDILRKQDFQLLRAEWWWRRFFNFLFLSLLLSFRLPFLPSFLALLFALLAEVLLIRIEFLSGLQVLELSLEEDINLLAHFLFHLRHLLFSDERRDVCLCRIRRLRDLLPHICVVLQTASHKEQLKDEVVELKEKRK